LTSAPPKGRLAEGGARAKSGLAGAGTSPDGNPTEGPEGPKGPTRSRHRWRRRLLLTLGAVVVVFVAATLALFVFPQTDQPTHVDGILSLNGGDEQAREAQAISLAKKGYAPVILFSQGSLANDTPCPKVPKVSVVCFIDATNNTRGEARWAGRYAARHHWHSLMIVPGRIQTRRALLLTERCFPGQVLVEPATEPLREIPGDVVHEWGGWLAALLIYRGC
jgi:uncharacterized SAM-binding protein YcdF (DUF218 family)